MKTIGTGGGGSGGDGGVADDCAGDDDGWQRWPCWRGAGGAYLLDAEGHWLWR